MTLACATCDVIDRWYALSCVRVVTPPEHVTRPWHVGFRHPALVPLALLPGELTRIQLGRATQEVPNERNGQIRAQVGRVLGCLISDDVGPGARWLEAFAPGKSFGEVRGHIHGQVSTKSRAIEGKSRRLALGADLAGPMPVTLV